MSDVWGQNLKISLFGESHGEGIGVVIDGVPSGLKIDMDFIKSEMARRAPGKNKLSTKRKEADEPRILSGVFNGTTTGAAICAVIENTDTKSKDYSELKKKMRPGHSDYAAYLKYVGFNDYRGGGHFSGRITAPIVFAGAVAKQLLAQKGIRICSWIKSIEDIEDVSLDKINVDEVLMDAVQGSDFPVLTKELGEKMQERIVEASMDCDSLGGVVQCAAINIPGGIGSPFFRSVESVLASILFSVPAVKGVEFGEGFNISKLRGSQANDEMYYDADGNVKTYTNNNGGLTGGIANGMPITFNVAIKPTPSISKEQRTIDIEAKENTTLVIHGRHDPCIVHRVIPVIESVTAIALAELIL